MHLRDVRATALLPALVLALFGCAPEGNPPEGSDDFPLSDVNPIYDDAPADRGMSLPVDGKADDVYPATFDLVASQSPIRSQGSRGTCSIFSTTALMEHLYIAEGTLENPDFSEQFLQWSAKVEVGAFTNTSGSSAQRNLEAINRFGIVEESVWPYENNEWGTSNDEACTGDSRPVRCYTNGDPSAEQLMATRYQLPRGRYINPRVESIKGHMVSTQTAVVVGGDFFYQSWNHGRSRLTTNSDYSAEGYVLSPNAEDRMDSSGDRRAGHSFLLVGWDDTLEVPRVDGEGNQIMGDDGMPEMEVGFFLFKNSWGTGRFGTRNPHGAGYGWISYRYVEAEMTAYGAGLPDAPSRAEVCNDGTDNDRNGQTDCDDAACASDVACMTPADTLENNTVVAIPDNDPAGASTTIEVTEAGAISSLAVTVDITHSYRGDLTLRLVREGAVSGEAILVDQAGGAQDDIQATFNVTDFNGTDAAGTYRLLVVDNAGQDTGSLNSWSVDLTRCMSDCGDTPTMREPAVDSEATPLPDEATTQRTLTIAEGGEIADISVTVDITHTYPADLAIRFQKAGGREFVLFIDNDGDEGGVRRTFDVPGYIGEDAAGDWTLTVVDRASGDEGTLNSWSIQITTR